MGCSPLGSKCRSTPYAVPNSNPNPKNFIILNSYFENGFLLVEVKYPDANNFEGVKILIYRDFPNIAVLLKVSNDELDPHFDEGCISPVARFKPTTEGRMLALKFMTHCGD